MNNQIVNYSSNGGNAWNEAKKKKIISFTKNNRRMLKCVIILRKGFQKSRFWRTNGKITKLIEGFWNKKATPPKN
jgi:hypothetical protein